MGKQKERLSELWGSKESQQRTGSGAVLENDVHKWAQQFQNKEFLGNCEKQEKYIFTVLAENVSSVQNSPLVLLGFCYAVARV